MSPTSQSAAAPRTTGSLYGFFGPGGLLSRTHPKYEFRRGQLQMAEAVEQALAEKRHLVVEAGTGTGKTLAYLVPVIRSGKRVVISTGTKNLQEQLFYKDVPFLERALYPNGKGELRVCYMKGRNNYLCRQKLYDLAAQPVLNGLEEIEQYRAIAEWEKMTINGDRAELSGLPESAALWHKLDARSEACTGQKCPQFDRCFITEMRRRAAESDIIIVNHHLFFADLAVKLAAENAPDAGILPDCSAVVFDEAHELEEVAGQYFGISVSNLRVDEVCRDIEQTLRQKQIAAADVLSGTANLRQRAQFFFAVIPPGDGRFAFEHRREFLEENGEEFVGVMQALGRLHSELQGLSSKPDEIYNLIRRSEELRAQLAFTLETDDPNTVVWVERRRAAGSKGLRNAGESVFLQATPIDVSGILRETLFQQLETVVLTSATLAVSGGFEYIRKRLGLEQARELVVASHFDYPSQALLYIPPELPDPRTDQFAARAAERIQRVLEITRGRAFCLFTSYAQMNEIYYRLLDQLEFPLLLQGSAPRTALLEQFRTTPNAVLFATSSFWQGVDVQGEQLSCVIIDRLPFAVPNDPVVAARIRAIETAGGRAFFEYQVPAAVITLKQGFGRLIRSLHDRGVLMLLDNRILKKQYGRVFLESLPPYRRTTRLEDVEHFFGAQCPSQASRIKLLYFRGLMKVFVIIPAAGLGTRMGPAAVAGKHAKQFTEIEGVPIVIHTLRKFARVPAITETFIAMRPAEAEAFLPRLKDEKFQRPVHIVEGGEHRQESVANALAHVRANEDDVVLVHDAVRPFIDRETIESVIAEASRCGAAIAGVPAVDTVKQVDRTAEGAIVTATVPRERVVLAQTPQGFRYGLLKRAFDQTAADGFVGTDEASIVERSGQEVAVVMGSPRNIKITTPADLELAEFYFAQENRRRASLTG